MTYDELHRRSLADPEGFWAEEAESVLWRKRWTRPLDSAAAPFYRWFPGGQLNTCENAVDRHVADGFGDQPALICDSPMTDSRRVFTYAQLQKEVALLAGGLARKGVQKGDRVVIYMPMVPEAVFAMLACARLGAVHSVVFGGFSAKELAARIDDAQAKFVLSASCGLEPNRVVEYKPMLDGALKAASHQVAGCAILQRDAHSCQLVPPRHGVGGADRRRPRRLRSGGGRRPALYSLHIRHNRQAEGNRPRQRRTRGGAEVDDAEYLRFQARRGLLGGVGHRLGGGAFLHCLRPAVQPQRHNSLRGQAGWHAGRRGVLAGCAGAQGLHNVHRAHRPARHQKRRPDGKMVGDLGGLRTLFLAGERCDPDSVEWAERHLKVPVIDHWWQTETGWAIAANPLGLERFPVKLGSATKPMPGYDLRALDEEGGDMPAGELGNLAVKLPLPPGHSPPFGGTRRAVGRDITRAIRAFT